MTHYDNISIADFSRSVTFLPEKEAALIRRRFVERRIDLELLKQHPGALELRPFPDGPSYEGYLWDYLIQRSQIDERELWKRLTLRSPVYAMWDLHSVDRVLIPDYFRFPRGTVIYGGVEEIRVGINLLPEDIYFFDADCEWAGARTHENDGGTRYCIWSDGSNPDPVQELVADSLQQLDWSIVTSYFET